MSHGRQESRSQRWGEKDGEGGEGGEGRGGGGRGGMEVQLALHVYVCLSSSIKEGK